LLEWQVLFMDPFGVWHFGDCSVLLCFHGVFVEIFGSNFEWVQFFSALCITLGAQGSQLREDSWVCTNEIYMKYMNTYAI
jgi:hypothetical protein